MYYYATKIQRTVAKNKVSCKNEKSHGHSGSNKINFSVVIMLNVRAGCFCASSFVLLHMDSIFHSWEAIMKMSFSVDKQYPYG